MPALLFYSPFPKGTPLHYLVADANGNAATIEFPNRKLVVHRGNDLQLPVITNDTMPVVNRKFNPDFAVNQNLSRWLKLGS